MIYLDPLHLKSRDSNARCNPINVANMTIGRITLFVAMAGFLGNAFAARDAINPFEGINPALFLIGGLLAGVSNFIDTYPTAMLCVSLFTLAASGVVLKVITQDDKKSQPEKLPAIASDKPSLWRLLPWSVFFLSLLSILNISLIWYPNFTINNYVKNGDYEGLRSYLKDCSSCWTAINADDAPLFTSALATARKNNAPIEIVVLLCQKNDNCTDFKDQDTKILETANPKLIDDFLSDDGVIFCCSGAKKNYALFRTFVATGRIDILEVLAKHNRLWLSDESTHDPSLNLLNVAIHSPTKHQADIMRLLVQQAEMDGHIEDTPKAYLSITKAYFDNSIKPLIHDQIRKKDLLTPPKSAPSQTSGITHVRASPLGLALNWHHRDAWLKKVTEHFEISFPELLTETRKTATCMESIRMLVAAEPSFGEEQDLLRKYCR